MNAKRKDSKWRWLIEIAFVAVFAYLAWWIWAPKDVTDNPPATSQPTSAATAENIAAKETRETHPAAPLTADKPQADQQPSPQPAPPIPISMSKNTQPTASLTETEATAAYQRGMELLNANELVQARSQLCRAYYSGRLSAARQDEVRSTLRELADITLIGRSSTVFPGDPYVFHYEFQPGERLGRLERRLKLHVPWQIILRINSLERAEDIKAGRVYKMIRGPFHAVVHKSAFAMDIYLQREDLERVFIKRLRIGIGKNGSTPAGMWRVKLGGKEHRPTWYPPPNSAHRGPVPYGEAGYAFGAKGLWISLDGLDEHTRSLGHYGIHSTNDPTSIGRAESLGCIRLADDDIELVYSLLYEHWSTVEVRP